jgi:hypothetical protein
MNFERNFYPSLTYINLFLSYLKTKSPSPTQIHLKSSRVGYLGLPGIRLRRQTLTKIPNLPEFGYLGLHGLRKHVNLLVHVAWTSGYYLAMFAVTHIFSSVLSEFLSFPSLCMASCESFSRGWVWHGDVQFSCNLPLLRFISCK